MTNLEEEHELFQKRVEELKAILQGFEVFLPECTVIKMVERHSGMIPIERFMACSDYPSTSGAMPTCQCIQDDQAKHASEVGNG